MKLNFQDTFSKRKLIPKIGDRRRFNVNGKSMLLTLNYLKIERCYDYCPESGSDHAWYQVEFVFGDYKNR